jgi:hypothetical protein
MERTQPTRRYFTLPGVYELCEKLGVQRSGSDTLTAGDIRSPRRYRQALHREYIKRRPGQYPRSWLASRLGVSIRSEQRYNLMLSIQVQPRYLDRRISWGNLNEIPVGFEVAGTYLVDETGKRYPARQEIAAHLLSKRHMVIYRRQTTNYYCINEPPPAAVPRRRGEVPTRLTQSTVPDSAQLSRVEVTDPPTSPRTFCEIPPVITLRPPPPVQPISVQHTQPEFHRPPVRSKRYYRRPLNDSRMEEGAQKIYKETSANTGGMSLPNARRLVDTYGVEACEAALKRMLWLRRRNKAINNAAGFLVVVTRLLWRLQHGATDLGSTAPRFRAEPKPRKRGVRT